MDNSSNRDAACTDSTLYRVNSGERSKSQVRGNQHDTPWTKEREADFVERIANGASIREASKAVGVTEQSGYRKFDRIRALYGEQGK